MANKGIVIEKFGGTSLSSPSKRQRVAEIVEAVLRQGLHAVVVVSAPGRRGAPYATDTLLELARGELGMIPARESDLLVGCGEIISAVLLATRLRACGIAAKALTGGQAGVRTDTAFQNARIVQVLPAILQGLVDEGVVPVVAGFQGVTPDGDLTTLGRGGSDTSAAALGAALAADYVDIYTDVDGVKTADPRIVPEAHTIASLAYDELFQMTHAGSRVVHPRAVEIARQAQVPLRVRSTVEEREGTWIGAPRFVDNWTDRLPERSVVGVSDRSDIAQAVVETRSGPGRQRSEARIFKGLAVQGISIDMISVTPGRTSFIVDRQRQADTEGILLRLGFAYRLRSDVAKVTVIGSAIHGLPGVMVTLMDALIEASVAVLATSDSHSSIACLVPEDQREDAVRALHRRFGLG